VRRQTATSGINPAGSSRALRLDPLSLPVSYNAQDTRADGGRAPESNFTANASSCTVPCTACGWRSTFASAISSVSHCAVSTMPQMLVLVHRDPSLTIPLCVSSDRDEIATAWQMWSDIFALPQLPEEKIYEPAPTGARPSQRDPGAASRKFLVRPGAVAICSILRIFMKAERGDHRAGISEIHSRCEAN